MGDLRQGRMCKATSRSLFDALRGAGRIRQSATKHGVPEVARPSSRPSAFDCVSPPTGDSVQVRAVADRVPPRHFLVVFVRARFMSWLLLCVLRQICSQGIFEWATNQGRCRRAPQVHCGLSIIEVSYGHTQVVLTANVSPQPVNGKLGCVVGFARSSAGQIGLTQFAVDGSIRKVR